jgi:hypothetical protein
MYIGTFAGISAIKLAAQPFKGITVGIRGPIEEW